MSHVTIRSAHTGEQKLLEELQRRASLSNVGDRDALLAHPDAIKLPIQQIQAGGVFVAEAPNSIVGFAAILKRGDGDFELDALFVEPSIWRQGIGRRLVEHCVTMAGNAGAASIRVIGNPHAERFYGACGFNTVGTTETRFGIGLLMKREL